MSWAASELGALFRNAKTTVPMRKTLEELGHAQPLTPIQTDNSTAYGVVNNKIIPKATKAMDMRFYWLKDRESQKQFNIHWRPRKKLADYWTKSSSTLHHQMIRPIILSNPRVLNILKKSIVKQAKAAAAA